MMKHSEEFKQEAVRIALTSGLSRERAAKDLGIGNDVPPIFSSGLNASFPVVFPLC